MAVTGRRRSHLIYHTWLVLTLMFVSLITAVDNYQDSKKDNEAKQFSPPMGTNNVLLKHAEINVEKATNEIEEEYILYCPDPCVCQGVKLYCDSLGLTRVPRNIPQETEVLMLKENKLRKIWQKQLAGLESLKHLNLKFNRILYIEPSSFWDMPKLNSLNLMENRIRYLSPMTFIEQKNLQFLSIQNNRLKAIEGLFRKLHKLHLLNLGGNLIKKITKKTFKYNPNIRILDLHHNRLKYIDKHAFTNIPLLKFLILRDNPLTIVDMNFKMNFHLELLDFTNCKLKRMVRGLPYSIKDLRLAENSITKLEDEDFKSNRWIRLLDLTGNKIESISDGAFHKLLQLYDLHLSKNKIKTLPPKLPKTLHGLYAAHNKIRRIEKTVFDKTPNLEFLYLKANRIESVEADTFEGLRKLKSLDLSTNGLEDLNPLAFSYMKHLQVLDLSENPLEHIKHSAFNGLTNLHILQMSSVSPTTNWSPVIFKEMKRLLFLDLQNSSALVRHLAENPYVLHYLRSVEDLNIIDAGLFSLPKSFPKRLRKLKSIKMIGNPWHCDRSIYWLTLWMRRGHVKFFNPEHMLCASPPELKGKKIKELLVDELPTIPPPRKQTPDLEVIDIPIKHTFKQNVTLVFNISSRDPGKERIPITHHDKGHVRSKHKNNFDQVKKKTKYKRPTNDIILGDSGTVYNSGNDEPLSKEEILIKETQKERISYMDDKKDLESEETRVDSDGSGNIASHSTVLPRRNSESSGESEPLLIT